MPSYELITRDHSQRDKRLLPDTSIGARAGSPASIDCFVKMLDLLKQLLETAAVYSDKKYSRAARVYKIHHLIKASADKLDDQDSDGNTCLHGALQRLDDLFMIIDELLNAGASSDLANCEGRTALWIATNSPYDSRDMIAKLVSKLADSDTGVDKADRNDWTSLHNAAYFSKSEVVRMLLAAGASVHLKTDADETALLCGVSDEQSNEEHQVEVARQLIAAGADVDAANKMSQTSLHIACSDNRMKICELLLAHGASLTAVDEEGDNALFYATVGGSADLVRRLIAAGADVNYVNKSGLCDDNTLCGPATALHIAVSEGNEDMLRCLLDCGADPNRTNAIGTSVLSFAITKKSPNHQDSIIEILLDRGADMYDGGVGQIRSPFETLVCEGRLLELQLFFGKGFDLSRYNPRAPDDFSPLHEAILSKNSTRVLKLLLRYNSQGSLNLDHEDKNGFSPLCVALRGKSSECAKLLLKAGANVNHVNTKGRTALEIMLSQSQPELEFDCVQLLVEAGATVNKVLREVLMPDSSDVTKKSSKSSTKHSVELAKRIIKFRVLYESLVPISDPIEQEIVSRFVELQSHYNACKAETVLLKNSPLHQPITYYHVLAADEKFYKSVTDIVFEAFDETSVKSRFPLYAEEICNNFKSVKHMYEIWERAQNNLRYGTTPIFASDLFD